MPNDYETDWRAWEGRRKCEGNTTGSRFGLIPAATGAGDHVYVDRERVETRWRDIVAVGVENSLGIVLVCAAEERRH